MLYSGQCFSLKDSDGILELHFDTEGGSVNVFNREAIGEFAAALDVIEKQSGAKGLMFTSGKRVFIAGADITEFISYFAGPPEELKALIQRITALFNRLELLPFPTVACINGEAQGGGLETALACDFRLMADSARIGLPEVKLGILPGWGGTIRLSRLVGIDNALEWMCGGEAQKGPAALKAGAVDAVLPIDELVPAARQLIADANAGKFDIQARRAVKRSPVRLSKTELMMAIESAKGVVGAKAGPNYPAPMKIIDVVSKHALLPIEDAMPIEAQGFVDLGQTDVAEALVGIFLKDQAIKRIAKQYTRAAKPVDRAAVLGAGIMGGGIAYQSASSGVPITMKDIRPDALEAGLEEASKLLLKQVERGRMKAADMARVLASIQPTLNYGDFGAVDLVVEAVVENPKVKAAVLAEVEAAANDGTVITTNTSTISVNGLAEALKAPEHFCGMHFFNPVHRMPLVEVIRHDKVGDEAVATTVAYALAMRKSPIVVNDCPGFLVNRILFAYFSGFNRLIADGANYEQVDKVMEKWGWPMGPAYLLDVVGMDTARHAAEVMAQGFPDRMSSGGTVIDAMYESERLGQKNGLGFYQYAPDKKGRPKKSSDEAARTLVAGVQQGTREFTEQDIIDRLMIPMGIETARCVEDNIVSTPAEADMGLVYGIGFPPFRGGMLHWIDKQGMADFCQRAEALSELGPLYQTTARMREMAENNTRYYPTETAARTGGAA